MDADLNTLATALCVRIDDAVKDDEPRSVAAVGGDRSETLHGRTCDRGG